MTTSSKLSVLSVILSLFLCAPFESCSAFVATNGSSSRVSVSTTSSNQLHATSNSDSNSNNNSDAANSNRRTFLHQSILAATAAVSLSTVTVTLAAPLPASAKDKKESAPLTRSLVTQTFSSIRDELTLPTGRIPTLHTMILSQQYPEIMEYTKESDAYFRRAKLGKARKLLTDKNFKDGALQLSNAVTFDLIGINRASRPGRESTEEALRYWEELKGDVEKFLELEGTIVVEVED